MGRAVAGCGVCVCVWHACVCGVMCVVAKVCVCKMCGAQAADTESWEAVCVAHPKCTVEEEERGRAAERQRVSCKGTNLGLANMLPRVKTRHEKRAAPLRVVHMIRYVRFEYAPLYDPCGEHMRVLENCRCRCHATAFATSSRQRLTQETPPTLHYAPPTYARHVDDTQLSPGYASICFQRSGMSRLLETRLYYVS